MLILALVKELTPFATSTLTYILIFETIQLPILGKGIPAQALKILILNISSIKIYGASIKTVVSRSYQC